MIHSLTRDQRVRLREKVLSLFLTFCRQEFQTELYRYQVRVARALLHSLLVEPVDAYVKIARQAGKTEVLTLLFKFLIIYHVEFLKRPLMAAIASPKGEQAKTDVDRIKKSIGQLKLRWHLEDRENNAATIRAYRNGKMVCEMFRFSLMPTTSLESKTLNVLAVEESHKADHVKLSDECDPMLASTNGVTWHFGVGCIANNAFKKGCDGELPDSLAIKVDVEEVIRDRREVYERTGDPSHLAYEKKFRAEERKKGRQNPEIRRNYYLEDTVEEGNFISRERLLSHGRLWLPCADAFFLGLDWARSSDSTWATLGNDTNDVIAWMKYPHARYEEQIELLVSDLKRMGVIDRIAGVRGDATGLGDMPMEYLANHTVLPVDDESKVKFTLQSKNDLYVNWQEALFKDPADEMAFTYPLNHPLTAEFEEQTVALLREYKGEAELLSVHHPDTPDARDDAPDSTALMLFASAGGGLGEILVA